MVPDGRGGVYGRPPREADRRATWRSVTAGFALAAGTFAALVAASHPWATAGLVAAGTGLYAVGGVLRRSTIERTLQVCGPRFCLQLQLRVG